MTEAGPRVSVVLIFLNAAAYLDEAIDSVEAQTLPAWELILVDDGSDDGSTAIATRRASARADRIRCLHHQGHRTLGMSASRNLGVDAARAELITFLDADDVLRPPTLAALAAIMDRRPEVAMTYAPLEYWYSWRPGGPARGDFVQSLGVPTGVVLQPPELLCRFLARRAAAPSGVMVRAACARAVGGFENAFTGMYEDQAFCAKVCLRWPVATGDYVGYRYRQHDRSSSALADGSGIHESGRRQFLDWLSGYLATQGVTDGRLLQTLRREQWWLRHPELQRLSQRLRRVRRRVGRRLAALAFARPRTS